MKNNLNKVLTYLVIFLLQFCVIYNVKANELYAGQNGNGSATGTSDSPYDLKTALEKIEDNGTIIITSNITLSGPLEIANGKNITLKSNSENHKITRNNYVGRMINISGNSTVTLENITLDGEKETKKLEYEADNQLIRVENSTLNIKEGTVLQNNETTWTGTIVITNGTLNMTGGKISGNVAGYGGAIYIETTGDNKSIVNLSGGEISDNKAKSYGGGAINAVQGSELNISGNIVIKNNDAGTDAGGAIKIKEAVLNISGGTINNNKASDGGGLWIENCENVTINGVTIDANKATKGAGIWLNNSKAKIGENTVITQNETTGGDGGGVWLYDTVLSLEKNASFTKNKANGKLSEDSGYNNVRGGAMFIHGNSKVTINDEVSFSENVAPYGGAIYLFDTANLIMQGGTISKNIATVNAGAICVFRSDVGAPTLTILKGKITSNENTAEDVYDDPEYISDKEFSGGAIYIGEDCTLNLSNAIITGNSISQTKFITDREQDAGYFAGGIGLCPNASAQIYNTSGDAIYNNVDNGGADIIYIPNTSKLPFRPDIRLFLSDFALGGGKQNWKALYGSDLKIGMQVLQENQRLGFVANLSEDDISKAQEIAQVYITGNKTNAIFGGGAIMNNGILKIGTIGSITVTKRANDIDANTEFNFEIDLHDSAINGKYSTK